LEEVMSTMKRTDRSKYRKKGGGSLSNKGSAK